MNWPLQVPLVSRRGRVQREKHREKLKLDQSFLASVCFLLRFFGNVWAVKFSTKTKRNVLQWTEIQFVRALVTVGLLAIVCSRFWHCFVHHCPPMYDRWYSAPNYVLHVQLVWSVLEYFTLHILAEWWMDVDTLLMFTSSLQNKTRSNGMQSAFFYSGPPTNSDKGVLFQSWGVVGILGHRISSDKHWPFF